MDRGIPKIFLDVIITWYGDLYCRGMVTTGIRQGGVLSPDFYSIYVDDLICIMRSSGVGCYLVEKFAAALMFNEILIN